MIESLGSTLTSAQLCRANGWEAGTVLHSPEETTDAGELVRRRRVLLLVAVGDSQVQVREWSYGAQKFGPQESWLLSCRSWRSIGRTGSDTVRAALRNTTETGP